jgi:hypothetical protein
MITTTITSDSGITRTWTLDQLLEVLTWNERAYREGTISMDVFRAKRARIEAAIGRIRTASAALRY